MAFEDIKEKIRQSPISQVISHYIPLRKRGANLEGICPFHQDTKPSLKVSDAKGMYKCFACGAGGDAISFVKNYKNLEFIDTIKELSSLLGIPYEDVREKKKNPKQEMGSRILNASLKIYNKIAELKPEEFVQFKAKRKLNDETIAKWQIGYTNHSNVVTNYLLSLSKKSDISQEKFILSTAQEMGLIKYHSDRQKYYDFYRNRIMFPILDHYGQIRGYSSRATQDGQLPKYLNSGESFIFDKSSLLFGFYFARSEIRAKEQVIIVEGHMDVIMMHQFGFTQTVGTMGTALSEKMTKLLTKLTPHIYLAMDNDEAGKKASKKINSDFLQLGILPKNIDLSPAKDPDEFLNQFGRLALQEKIDKAPYLIDFLIEQLIPKKFLENTNQKLEILNQVFELLSPLKEDLIATERILLAAQSLGLRSEPQLILESYKEFLQTLTSQKKAFELHKQQQRSKQKSSFSHFKTTSSISDGTQIFEGQKGPLNDPDHQGEVFQDVSASNLHIIEEEDVFKKGTPEFTRQLLKSEKLLIKEIVGHPEFLTHMNVNDFLATIEHPEVKRLIEWLSMIYLEIDDAEYVNILQDEVQFKGYPDQIIHLVTEALFKYGEKKYNEKVIQRMLKDFQRTLKMDQLRAKRKVLAEKQKKSLLQSEIDFILNEITKLDKEILSIKNTSP